VTDSSVGGTSSRANTELLVNVKKKASWSIRRHKLQVGDIKHQARKRNQNAATQNTWPLKLKFISRLQGVRSTLRKYSALFVVFWNRGKHVHRF